MTERDEGTKTLAREIADAMPIIVWTHDDLGAPTFFNRRWTEYTGLSLEETVLRGTDGLIHPDDRPPVARDFASARASRQAFTATYRLRGRDGSYRWHEAHIIPLRAGADAVSLWVGTATDIDEHRRASDEQRYLVDASTVLGSSLELQRTLADVARLVVPTLADWCTIDLLRDDGTLERLAVAHVDPSKVKLAWDLWKILPPKPSDPNGAFAAMRTRKPELVTEVTDEMLALAIPDPHVLELCRGLGLRSSICVPLVARGRVLGALSLVTAESGKLYGARDVAFAEEVARRISVAIDNARLYEEATRARVAAEAMAADVLDQSKAVEAALLTMRGERDEARALAEGLRTRAGSAT
jgi:PAS domain S-box-containing protein